MAQGRAISANISSILAKIESDLEGVQKEFLTEVAEDIVQNSPVWTGRYVTSHSIGSGSAAGQFTGNIESPGQRTSVPEAYKAEARANLAGDIAALPPKAERVYINNNSPHANFVEYGTTRMAAHGVFSGAMSRAGIHLQTAINRVKGGQ